MTDLSETANSMDRPDERPECRIEQALDRIAYALHQSRRSVFVSEATMENTEMEWQPVVANIEALRLRVRDLIDRLNDEETI